MISSKSMRLCSALSSCRRYIRGGPARVNDKNVAQSIMTTERQESLTTKIDPLSSDFDREFLDTIEPSINATFNFGAIVNRSETLKQLVKLGVDLSVVEKNREATELVVHLDFDRNIKPYLTFLVDLGVKPHQLGSFITENPLIFRQSLSNIKTRVDYLLEKKFPKEAITEIISLFPSFLNYSVKQVDARLGFLQAEYSLTAKQIRSLLFMYPQVMTLHVMSIRTLTIAMYEGMGFSKSITTSIIVQTPRILGVQHETALRIFDQLHNKGKIPQEIIAKFPEVLCGDEKTVTSRLKYLLSLKRAQFDPKKPLFVPLTALSDVEDRLFAEKYAHTTIEDYDLFLRTR